MIDSCSVESQQVQSEAEKLNSWYLAEVGAGRIVDIKFFPNATARDHTTEVLAREVNLTLALHRGGELNRFDSAGSLDVYLASKRS